MRMQRVAVVLSVLNGVVLIGVLTQRTPVSAQTTPAVVRTQALEVVDGKGQVRAALTVEPNGETVFRLRDPNGTIRVKLGASAEGSALLLIDGTTEPGVHILARKETTFTMRGTDGKQRPVKP